MTPVLLREWQRTEVNASDLGFSQDDWLLAAELERRKILVFRPRGATVSVHAGAHVGRLQLGALQVTITPKVGEQELLGLVCYAYATKAPRLFQATDQVLGGSLFQDVLIGQLLREATELWRRGLRRDYREQREWLSSPRGNIRVNAMIGELPRAELPCSYYSRGMDIPLNRVLLSGLARAAEIVVDRGLRTQLRLLASRFEGHVGRVRLSRDRVVLAVRSIDRLTSHYSTALKLIELILEGESLLLDDGQSLRLPGFAFDMNRFFQALLSRFLRDHLPDYEVQEEKSLTEVFAWTHNPNDRRRPKPRPDYAVRRKGAKGSVVRLLDAKYRDLWEHSLDPGMLYQLTIYALSQNRGEPATAAILYPTTSANATLQRVEVLDPLTSMPRGYVELRPVILSELLAGLGNREGRCLAKRLVGGE